MEIMITKKQTLFVCLLFLAIGFLIYSPSLNGDFIWDDVLLVSQNSYIRDLSFTPRMFSSDWGEGVNTLYGYYRPLAIFSYFLNYSVHKLHVFGYHFINLLLHSLVSITFFFFSLHIFKKFKPSFIAGLMFLTTPIHSTLACYISGRADLFASFFILLALIQYMKFLNEKVRIHFISFFLFFILALLSKEIALILPVLCLLYSCIIKRKPDIRTLLINLSIILFFLFMRSIAINNFKLTFSDIFLTLGERIPGIFIALFQYIRLFVLPINLRMDYGNIVFSFTDLRCITGIFIFFFLLVFASRNIKKNPIVSFSLFWFFICLLPVSNIYPLAFYMAEHFLYLPSVGIFIISSFYLCKIKNKRILYTLILLITFTYSVMSFKQSFFWKDPISLYKRSLSFNADNWVVHNNISLEYLKRNDFEQSIYHLKRSQSISQDFNNSTILLAKVYLQINKDNLGIKLLKKHLETHPTDLEIYDTLAIIYISKGKFQDASELLNNALKINPNNPHIYNTLSLIYHLQKKPDKEFSYLQHSFNLNKNNVNTLTSIGNYYASRGAADQAIVFYERVLALSPANKDALNNLATTFFFKEKYSQALKLYKLALKVDPFNKETQRNIQICLTKTQNNK